MASWQILLFKPKNRF